MIKIKVSRRKLTVIRGALIASGRWQSAQIWPVARAAHQGQTRCQICGGQDARQDRQPADRV